MFVLQNAAAHLDNLAFEANSNDESTPSIMAYPPFTTHDLSDPQFFSEKLSSCDAQNEGPLLSGFYDASIIAELPTRRQTGMSIFGEEDLSDEDTFSTPSKQCKGLPFVPPSIVSLPASLEMQCELPVTQGKSLSSEFLAEK